MAMIEEYYEAAAGPRPTASEAELVGILTELDVELVDFLDELEVVLDEVVVVFFVELVVDFFVEVVDDFVVVVFTVLLVVFLEVEEVAVLVAPGVRYQLVVASPKHLPTGTPIHLLGYTSPPSDK
jgi:hypothetical protein